MTGERPTLTRRPDEMPPHPPFRRVRRGARRPRLPLQVFIEERELRHHYFGDPYPHCEPPCPECP